MKNQLFERITRFFAPPTRIFAMLFTIAAFGAVRATESLEETGGFVTTTSQLAFKGVSLSAITDSTLSARFTGSSISNPGGAATFCCFGGDGVTTKTCEAQIQDGGYVKSLSLTFTQSGEDVNVVANWTKYSDSIALGTTLSNGSSGTIVVSPIDAGYGLYDLQLSGRGVNRGITTAATVFWDKDFDVGFKVGTDGQAYSFTLNPSGNTGNNLNSVDENGCLVIGSGSKYGGHIVWPRSGTCASVLIKYSTLSGSLGVTAVLSSAVEWSSKNGYIDNLASIKEANGTKITGRFWNRTTAYGGDVANLITPSGYLLIVVESGSNLKIYTSNDGNSWNGGDCTNLNFASYMGGVGLGGDSGLNSGYTPFPVAAGMTIEGVAIFRDRKITPFNASCYHFPSQLTQNSYSKWAYATSILKWNTPSSDNDSDILAGQNVSYKRVNVATGVADETPITDGRDASATAVVFKRFSYGADSTYGKAHTPPGDVLHFTSGDYKKNGITGGFAPLTYGGIIVDAGASGYTYTGNKATALGDPRGEVETWFEINDAFSINRTGGVALMGVLNMDIGGTFTLGSNAQIAKKWDSVYGNLPTVNTSGGELKMHGTGQLTVPQLTATGATLDYSDLAADRAAAFIDGALVINSSTTLKFPANAVFPYPVATSVSGTTSQYTVGGVDGTKTLVFSSTGKVTEEEDFTVSADINWSTLVTGRAKKAYNISVTDDATLTVDAAESDIISLKIDVAEGKTLTLAGANTLTAEKISITGLGRVKTANGSALAGTLTGSGTLIYSGAMPTGMTFTDSSWTGTLWLESITGVANFNLANYGSSESKITFAGVSVSLAAQEVTYSGSVVFADKLSDGETSAAYALEIAGGGTNTLELSGNVSGNGVLKTTSNAPGHLIWINDNYTSFSGSINNEGDAKIRIGTGQGSVDGSGWVLVTINAQVTIANTSSWYSKKGITIRAYGSRGDSSANFTNNGTITGILNVTDGTQLAYLTNTGTINVSSLDLTHGRLVNTGTISVSEATTVGQGGELSVNGGTVNIATLNANGTVAATSSITAQTLTVGASSNVTGTYNGGGSGTLTLNKASSADYTGYTTLNIAGGVTQADTGLELEVLTLGAGASYSTDAGKEGAVLFNGAGSTLTLNATAAQVNTEGHTPAIYGAGTVTYIDAASTGHMTTSGYVLLPYYNLWRPIGDAHSLSADACWPNSTAASPKMPTSGNIAFDVDGAAEVAITVDSTQTYTEGMVYSDGDATSRIGTFVQNGANTVTFTKLVVAGGTTLTLTSASGVSVTGSIVVEEGATLILDGYAPTVNITGSGTVKLAGTIALAANCSVAPALVVDAAATLNTSTFTLTASGNITVGTTGTLTVNGTIETSQLTVNGTVDLSSATLSGTTITGANTGVAIYNGKFPTEGLGWTDNAAWTGTVWVKNADGTIEPNKYGNAQSKVKFSGVQGNFPIQYTCLVPIELSNSGYSYGIYVKNGWSRDTSNTDRIIKLPKLMGNGAFWAGNAAATVVFHVTDWSEYTGSLQLANKIVVLGETVPAVSEFNESAGIYICSGATVAIPNGVSYRADGGIRVKGTLKFVESGATTANVTADANSTLDFSEASTGAHANSITLSSGTTIKLPAGTELPYQIATAGDVGVIDNVTVQIGSEAAVTRTVALRNGVITTLASVNIDTENTYAAADTLGTLTSTSSYEINVTADATLNFGADTAVDVLRFNIGTGKTLTISGGKLTANAIVVTGDGNLVFDVSGYDCTALARNAVAGAPYRVWPGNFSSATGNITIDTLSVEVPTGYSYSVVSTVYGPALEFTTTKQFGSLNINFYRDGTDYAGTKISDNASCSGLMHGAFPVVGTSWNDLVASNVTGGSVGKYVRSDGSVVNSGSATITIPSVGGWSTAVTSDQILAGYCDDGKQPEVTINNIPFAKYRVIVYAATDSDDIAFWPKIINGVSYSTAAAGSTATPTIPGGTGAWGNTTASRSMLAEGVNYLVSDVISGTGTVTINNNKPNSDNRACITAVQIVEVGVEKNTYDIDAANTYNLATIFPSMSNGNIYEINVNESATLDVGTAATAGMVVFNVASGKTLTISGSTITANPISVYGEGKIVCSAANTLSGTIKGDGRIVYVQTLPDSSLKTSFQDRVNWTGTVEIKNYTQLTTVDQHQIIVLNNYGNIYSTVALNGVTSTMYARATTSAYPDVALKEIEIGDDGWTDTDLEFSNADMVYTAKLTGHGLLTVNTKGAGTIQFIGNHTFDGSVAFGANTGKRVAFMKTSNDTPPSGNAKSIVVVSGHEMSIASGKSWSAANGVVVNGTLIFSGAGNVSGPVITATGSTLDFSEATSGACISGALTLASGTTIKLPSSATLPYQIATAGDYEALSDVTVLIGETTQSGNLGLYGGTIKEFTSKNIDTEKTYTVSEVFGTPTAQSSYEIYVTADAALNLDVPITVDTVKITVAANKTLTLTGESITASEIYVLGEGKVVCSAANTLSGTIKGDGRIVYTGTLPAYTPTASFQDSSNWTGTVEIKDYEEKTDGNGIIVLTRYGNIYSAVALNNVKSTMFANTNASSKNYPDVTLKEIEIGDGGWTDQARGEFNCDMFYTAKLTGHGTITVKTSGSGTIKFIGDHTFAGSVAFGDTTGKRVAFMKTSNDTLPSVTAKTIVVAGGLDMTIASGKTWTADAIMINGTLAVQTSEVETATSVTPTACLDGAGITTKVDATAGTTTYVSDKATVISDNQASLGAVTVTEPMCLAGSGGALMSSLTINDGITLTYDPVITPLRVESAPVFNGTGKLRLAPRYAGVTCGKFHLVTYPSSASVSGNLRDLVDSTSFNNATYTVTEETVTMRDGSTYNQLVLKVGNYDTAAKDISIAQFGDSITEGIWRDDDESLGGNPKYPYRGTPNYRIPLMHLLEAYGYNPETRGYRKVGSEDANGVKADDNYAWHTGISAQRIYTGGSNIRAGFMESIEAHLEQVGVTDVITLKIGTNDAIGNETADNMFEGWTNLVWKIVRMRPTSKIVVCAPVKIRSGEKNAPGLRTKIAEYVAKTAAQGGFPDGQVTMINGIGIVTDDANYYLKDNVHPNWNGHMQLANAWLPAVTNAFESMKVNDVIVHANTTYTPQSPVDSADDVEELEPYRAGYVKLATFSNVKTKLGAWGESPYAWVNDDFENKEMGRVAYFVARKTTASPDTRYVWVDMDADATTGTTLANFGVPTSASVNGVVNNLHIYSNSSAIENVAPTVSGVKGTLMRTEKGVSKADSIPTVQAPTGPYGFDWNDSIVANDTWGVMNVARIFTGATPTTHRMLLAAQMLFDFNGFNTAGNNNALGIGDFAVHGQYELPNSTLADQTLNWTFKVAMPTMDASALESGVIEIWGKLPSIENTADKPVGYMDDGTAVITNATGTIIIPESATALKTVVNDGSVTFTYTGSGITQGSSSITVVPTDAQGNPRTDAALVEAYTALFTKTVDNDTITVQLNESAVRSEVGSGVVASSSGVSFPVTMKPGLWYAVERDTAVGDGGALSGTPSFGDAATYDTETNGTLTAPLPTTGVLYYKIAVGTSKAAVTDPPPAADPLVADPGE